MAQTTSSRRTEAPTGGGSTSSSAEVFDQKGSGNFLLTTQRGQREAISLNPVHGLSADPRSGGPGPRAGNKDRVRQFGKGPAGVSRGDRCAAENRPIGQTVAGRAREIGQGLPGQVRGVSEKRGALERSGKADAEGRPSRAPAKGAPVPEAE